MDPSQPTPEALIALAGILVAEQSLEATLTQVLTLACGSLAGGDLGGITLLEREGPNTAVATDELARRVDAGQYNLASGGPCLDAYRRQVINRIDSTADEGRWPEFCALAAEAGILSILSLPLVVEGDGLGAINVYCRHAGGFSLSDEVTGAAFASLASVAMANARMYWRTQRLAGQLEEALSTRGAIEQAKGILMVEQGCSADEAFEMLVRASQRSHAKLHDVAAKLVARLGERNKGP
ncbi:MAG: ANTAR domain-containing protein [Acidimicrobiales bacterium]